MNLGTWRKSLGGWRLEIGATTQRRPLEPAAIPDEHQAEWLYDDCVCVCRLSLLHLSFCFIVFSFVDDCESPLIGGIAAPCLAVVHWSLHQHDVWLAVILQDPYVCAITMPVQVPTLICFPLVSDWHDSNVMSAMSRITTSSTVETSIDLPSELPSMRKIWT